MASSKTACTNDMHIVINRLSSNFFWGLEKTANVDIKAEISESTSNNFCTAIVAILTHLGDKDARVATFSLRECLHVGHSLLVLSFTLSVGLLKRLFAVSTTHDRVLGDMTTIYCLESHADFTNCGPLLSCLN